VDVERKRLRVRRASVALVTLASFLAIVACGDDDSDATDAAAETTNTTDPGSDRPDDEPADPQPSSTSPSTETTVEEGTVVEISVASGEVSGGGRHQIDLGDTVTIRVTSDVADHVHLHGYDVLADVGAGETSELVFDATIPGVFEVELEDSRIPLAELEIS
jgi:hypothetical protein